MVVAMRVADILALPVDERAQALFTPAQIVAMPAAVYQADDYVWCLINKERGITAICEGLVTPEQIAQMPNIWQ